MTETGQIRRTRTALGRARGRHRALLITTCVALLVAAVGDQATGYDGPGPFICAAFALLVALVPGRFTPLTATVMSAFFVVGGLASPAFVNQLLDAESLIGFVAGWVQMVGLGVAAVCATAAVATAPSSRHPSA